MPLHKTHPEISKKTIRDSVDPSTILHCMLKYRGWQQRYLWFLEKLQTHDKN